jgi:hypothetical protein
MATNRHQLAVMGGSPLDGPICPKNHSTLRARLRSLSWLQWPVGAALMIGLIVWVYWGSPPWL